MIQALTHGTGHEFALYENTFDGTLVIVAGGERVHFAFEREIQSICGCTVKLRASSRIVSDLQITAALIMVEEEGKTLYGSD